MFGHRWLVHNEHAITAFLNKKVNVKNAKTPLLITKTTYVKVQKYPQIPTLFC